MKWDCIGGIQDVANRDKSKPLPKPQQQPPNEPPPGGEVVIMKGDKPPKRK